jgi:hypothetical protein
MWGCPAPDFTDDESETTESGESGGTDPGESGTDETGTDETETDETETDKTTGEDMCGGWSMTASFIGARQPPEACSDYVFTGTLVAQHENGLVQLDSCPCDAVCDSPDPYELQLSWDGHPPTPDFPGCPQIELFRAANCDIVGFVVRDAQDPSAPNWWMASPDAVLPGFEWLSTQFVDQQICLPADDDVLRFDHSVRYAHEGDGIVLQPGETGILPDTPLGELVIAHGNAIAADGPNLGYQVVVN